MDKIKITHCNGGILDLMDAAMLTSFGNTKQNIVIKVLRNEDRYKTWAEKHKDDNAYTPNDEPFEDYATWQVADDILLYVFGMRKAYSEKKGSREAGLARQFWRDQKLLQPSNKDQALKTPQLEKYLIYDSKNRYNIGCDVRVGSDDNDALPKFLIIRLQSAQPLDSGWEAILERRLNGLFGGSIKYKSEITGLYDLGAITLSDKTDDHNTEE